MATKSAQKNASETLSGSQNFQIFLGGGGGMPPDHPRCAVGLCPQHNFLSQYTFKVWAPPPNFYYRFSALASTAVKSAVLLLRIQEVHPGRAGAKQTW